MHSSARGSDSTIASKVDTVAPRPRQGKLRPPSGVKFTPASTRPSSAAVRSASGPVASVVRSSVASWNTINTPSRETRRSNSKASTPSATASWNDASVFSGACARLPRWPITGRARGSRRIIGQASHSASSSVSPQRPRVQVPGGGFARINVTLSVHLLHAPASERLALHPFPSRRGSRLASR